MGGPEPSGREFPQGPGNVPRVYAVRVFILPLEGRTRRAWGSIMTMAESAPAPSDASPVLPRSREERILLALGDPIDRALLLALNERARTAPDLMAELRLPHSSVYRKLHELQELGLVGIQRLAITPQGKRVEYYRSLVSGFRVELEGGRLKVNVSLRDLTAERAKTLWDSMREEVRP